MSEYCLGSTPAGHSTHPVAQTCWKYNGSQRLRHGRGLAEQVGKHLAHATDSTQKRSLRPCHWWLCQKYRGWLQSFCCISVHLGTDEWLAFCVIYAFCRCNLASVVLQLLALGIPDVVGFDFMDKPSKEVSFVYFILLAVWVVLLLITVSWDSADSCLL